MTYPTRNSEVLTMLGFEYEAYNRYYYSVNLSGKQRLFATNEALSKQLQDVKFGDRFFVEYRDLTHRVVKL